jgi:plasmid stability protein
MKATIDFDEHLYRRLKIEAARRGRTVRELVAEGVRSILDAPPSTEPVADPARSADWRPSWYGALAGHARSVEDHSMAAIRESVAAKRAPGGAPKRRR